MSSSESRRVRTKICATRLPPLVNPAQDPWFREKKRVKRVAQFSSRLIDDRRWLSFGWLENQGFKFQRFLATQGLQRYCEFHHPVYTNSVREFYANFTHNEFGFQSWVNGQHLLINPADFTVLYGMKNEGLCLTGDDDNAADVLEVDPGVVYYNSLADKSVAAKSGRSIGHMHLDDRLLFWTLGHVLLPKTGNYGYPTDMDLQYMFAIQSEIQVNWVRVILHHMLKFSQSASGKLPYSMLISQFLVMKNVTIPFVDKDVEDQALNCCLNASMLKKCEIMFHAKRGWMSRLDYRAAVVADEQEKEEQRKKVESNKIKAPVSEASTSQSDDVLTKSFFLSTIHDLRTELMDAIEDHFLGIRSDLGIN